jgi:aminoglycoside/choline kinase family phosphotransferase
MITKGNVPRLIDYQGARIGPPAYDVASVLWDPYYRLEESLRERILRYYIIRMAESARWFNEKDFRESLIFCRLQRHMQALGAFGFLSEMKGKKYFLNHIPEGLRLLSEDLSEIKEQYPGLDELVKRV